MRRLFIALAGVVALYSPIELTRLIAIYRYEYGLTDVHWFELVYIWIGVLIFVYFWIQLLRR